MVVIGQGTQEYLNPALALPPLCVLKGVHVRKSMAKESKVTFFKWTLAPNSSSAHCSVDHNEV